MKFWQKSFLCIITIFLLGSDVLGYTLVKSSYALNQDYAVKSAETEQQVIQKSVFESLSLSSRTYSELNSRNLNLILSPYADFYKNQGIYFQIYQNDLPVYNNLPVAYNTKKFSIKLGERHTEVTELQGRLYCLIASYFEKPYNNLQFVYIRDMQPLVNFKSDIILTYTRISIAVSFALAVIMLALLIFLTKPFRTLNAVAAEISLGHYEKRVSIKSRDEIGDFAKSFNRMAEHIQTHIEELSQMSESKQRFIDNLAHETRTPITAVVGYGELLKYANCSAEEKEIAVEHIISQGKRIQNMVYKLMDLAYMDTKNVMMHPVKLLDLLSEAEAALETRMREKQIIFIKEIQPATVNGDQELLESLIINLIDNAIKASRYGGEIKILTQTESGSVSVMIIDNGRGMEKGEIEKITEPFYRIEKSRSRKEGGIGLGLSICARICEIHHAKLDIFSELGKGTSVTVSFTTL